MSNLLLIVVCLLAGLGLQRLKTLPRDTHVALNGVVLFVSLPAMIILYLPKLTWDSKLISLVFVAWIVFALAFATFSLLGKKLGWDKTVVGCLILTAGLGNTSFVGFPVIEALLGQEALKYAVLVDQPGSFLISSSIGLWIAHTYSQGHVRKRDLMKRVMVFPPFIAFCIGLSMFLMGLKASGLVEELLLRISGTLAPLALISVGLQLKVREIKNEWRFLTFGLAYKLVIAPLALFILYSSAGVPREIFQVSVLEAGMAPMITASIVAASYGLQPRLAGLMVGVGVPLSFLTLGAWYFFL